jgi:hypothetical protein
MRAADLAPLPAQWVRTSRTAVQTHFILHSTNDRGFAA